MTTKEYIIALKAQLTDNASPGFKKLMKNLNMVGTEAEKAGTKTQSFDDIIKKAGMRALVVAPVWLALRSAMMLVLRTVGDMVKANIDLEEGLARIQTVMQGTTDEISAQMIGIKRTIIDTSLTTRVSIKDLAEAFYFLKTSALTAEEAMAGFQPLVNIITGTNVKAQEASRGLAGMYNTLGKSLGDNLTPTQKMTKISDILTYTYANQDVEMGELIASYTKLAPYLVGLDDNFAEVVTTLGFLNTRLLRSGRAGLLTGRAILQLTKNAQQLSSIFGITFDPNQPINFLKVIEQLHTKMGDTTKLTSAQGDALQKVFATRAGVPIRLLLANFDELKETLKEMEDNYEGFAEKIADIRMNTTTAQLGEMHNALAVLTNDWLTGATSGEGMIVFLKQMNETLIALRTPVKRLGQEWGYMIDTLQAVSPSGIIAQLGGMLAGGAIVPLKKPKSWREYLKQNEEVAKKTEEQAKKDAETLKNADKISKETTDFKTTAQKLYDEELKSTYALMKANGASELDIQKAKVSEYTKAEDHLNKIDKLTKQITDTGELQKVSIGEASETLKARLMLLNQEFNTEMQIRTIREKFGSDEEYELAMQKEKNDLLEEEVKYRKKITDTLQTVGLDLLKQTGVQESVIISMKMRELALNRKAGDDSNYFAQLEALRLSRIQAIVSEKLKEKQTQDNLILSYQKADENERARIRRLIELRQMSTTEIETQYDTNAFDTGIIENNLDKFSEEVQQIITKKFAEKFKLPFEDKTNIIEDASKELNLQLTENTNALRELTRIIQMLSQGTLINAQNTNIPLALNQTTGQYNLPTVHQAYTAPVPLLAGSGYGRKESGEYVIADKSRNSLNLLVELDVKGLKEEMNNVIGDRVKKLIDTDPILQKLLRDQVINKI